MGANPGDGCRRNFLNCALNLLSGYDGYTVVIAVRIAELNNVTRYGQVEYIRKPVIIIIIRIVFYYIFFYLYCHRKLFILRFPYK